MQYLYCFKALISIIILYSWPIKSDEISNFQKPSTAPKYFAIDVDGTFYTDKDNVFKKNIEAFKLLKDKNITPFFCTGRGIDSNTKLLSSEFTNETGYNGYPGVYNNGTVVFDADGNIIKIEKFTEEFIDKFHNYATTKNINDRVIYYTDDKMYSVEKLVDEAVEFFINKKKFADIVRIDYNELKQKKIVLIVIFEMAIADFDSINDVNYLEMKNPEHYLLSLKGVNKKTGLEVLLTHFQSNANECVYIGDNKNDHEAMEYCYVSFAVGNADDDTKNKAKWVLDLKYDEAAFEKAVKLLVEDDKKNLRQTNT